MKQIIGQTLGYEPLVKENIVTIGSKRYGTGANGVGLYELIDPSIAYYTNEAVSLDEKFQITDKNNAVNEILQWLTKH